MTKHSTTEIASSNLLGGEKLYLKKARITLPYLVRQAKAGKTIYYSDLAAEINIPNPRNLNLILGAIGNALIKLDSSIPPIQCLVINKLTNFPGDGIDGFLDKKNFSKLNRTQKTEILNRALNQIYSYPRWEWVLQQLQLEPIGLDINQEIEKAKQNRGSGGESPFHRDFKNFIANNPSVIGLSGQTVKGTTEYILPSADSIDIVFVDKSTKIGIEVQSKISKTADILRGLFQCVKYKYLIEAEQIVTNQKPDSRVILVLEGQLPKELISAKNILGIEVIDKIKITANTVNKE
jgi:hypothetical protein